MSKTSQTNGRPPAGAVVVITGLLFLLIMLPVLLLLNLPQAQLQPATPTAGPVAPSPKLLPATITVPAPTPTPTLTPTPTVPARTATLNPQHGIHAPIGYQWTDPQRRALAAFKDSAGRTGAPGLVLALSSDMQANNNLAGARLEQDLHFYERQGAQIFIRLYPQRFPGGFTEPPAAAGGGNTVSGTPQDAAQDIFEFLDAQQRRNGWHFRRLIPGNEPDIEWPDELYGQNLLPWRGNGDPDKYFAINRFYSEVYRAWQVRAAQPDAALYRDVELYFPALAQDAAAGSEYYAGFYFYDNSRPVGNRYDALREAIELYGRFSWHNYFQPGRACRDVTAAALPGWLKAGLAGGWPAVISEAGWAPEKLVLAAQSDSRARIVRFWQLLGVRWEEKLYTDNRPQWRTNDETIDGARFEDDLRLFTGGCHLAGLTTPRPVGVAVWLAGSEGNFVAALGVEPGALGNTRRWLQVYAGLPL